MKELRAGLKNKLIIQQLQLVMVLMFIQILAVQQLQVLQLVHRNINVYFIAMELIGIV